MYTANLFPTMANLPTDQVMVFVSPGNIVSGIGRDLTHRAATTGDAHMIAYAAVDAGFVFIHPNSPIEKPDFRVPDDTDDGRSISVEEIDAQWGIWLRQNMGTRLTESNYMIGIAAAREGLVAPIHGSLAAEPRFICIQEGRDYGRKMSLGEVVDRWGSRLRQFLKEANLNFGAPLAQGLETGQAFRESAGSQRLPQGLLAHAGWTYKGLKGTPLEDMRLLFENGLHGPSLQAQLFLYTSLMALAALPEPLSRLISAQHFRVGASCCYPGTEAWESLKYSDPDDKFAYRLAAVLSTHGPALVNMALAVALSLSKVKRNPKLLQALRQKGTLLRNVPQAPLVSQGACAGGLINFADFVPGFLWKGYPGVTPVNLGVLTSADAILLPGGEINEGFGRALANALALEAAGREPSEALGVLSKQGALGTLVGNMGVGLIPTTLEFAFTHFLDVAAIVVGWGQSGESGGKQHAAGVGFGGENAIFNALKMAEDGHGFVDSFGYYVGHNTGTPTNAATELTLLDDTRREYENERGRHGPLRRIKVGAPKATRPGTGHSNGPAGLQSAKEAIHYVSGERVIGAPMYGDVHPDLARVMPGYEVSDGFYEGSLENGALAYVQGFAGYDGVFAVMPGTDQNLRRYPLSAALQARDPQAVEKYLERRPGIRSERRQREWRAHITPGAALQLALRHLWPMTA